MHKPFFLLEREVIYQQATESMIITYMELNYQHCDISGIFEGGTETCLLYTSPSPRDA